MHNIIFYFYAVFGAPFLLNALSATLQQQAVNTSLAAALLIATSLGFAGLYFKCLSLSARMEAQTNLTTAQIALIFVTWMLHTTMCIILALAALEALGWDVGASDAPAWPMGLAVGMIVALEFAALIWIFRIRPRRLRHPGWYQRLGDTAWLLFGCVLYTAYWDYLSVQQINDYTWIVFFSEIIALSLMFLVGYLPLRLPDLLEEFHLSGPRGRRRRMASMLGMALVLAVYPAVRGSLTGGRYTNLEYALENPSDVRKLYLSGRNLEQLPADIGIFTNLQILRLTENKLTDLPAEIGQLKALRELYVGNNRLQALPPEIGNLTNLTVLVAYSNYLDCLPEEIGRARRLQRINLRWNSLKNLPVSMRDLPDVQSLKLTGNRISEADLAVFDGTPVHRSIKLD